jgi:hypothetical protein
MSCPTKHESLIQHLSWEFSVEGVAPSPVITGTSHHGFYAAFWLKTYIGVCMYSGGLGLHWDGTQRGHDTSSNSPIAMVVFLVRCREFPVPDYMLYWTQPVVAGHLRCVLAGVAPGGVPLLLTQVLRFKRFSVSGAGSEDFKDPSAANLALTDRL